MNIIYVLFVYAQRHDSRNLQNVSEKHGPPTHRCGVISMVGWSGIMFLFLLFLKKQMNCFVFVHEFLTNIGGLCQMSYLI